MPKNEEQLCFFDKETSNYINFNILKIKINYNEFDYYRYSRLEHYSNRQIILLSNYLYYEKRDIFTYKLLSNPIIYIIKSLDYFDDDFYFRHDVLFFNKEISFNEILKYCQIYFKSELKKNNFPKEIINKFDSYFNVENDIDMDDVIIFRINNKKISNNLKFDKIIYEKKNLNSTYLQNKNI